MLGIRGQGLQNGAGGGGVMYSIDNGHEEGTTSLGNAISTHLPDVPETSSHPCEHEPGW